MQLSSQFANLSQLSFLVLKGTAFQTSLREGNYLECQEQGAANDLRASGLEAGNGLEVVYLWPWPLLP